MNTNYISTKIKIIGISFALLFISIVTTTIYLNSKNKYDAMIVNMAGKQRMLSQNISKNVFYLYSNPDASRIELKESIEEFIYNLNSLKGENNLEKSKSSPNLQIESQLIKVELLWTDFNKNISEFIEILDKKSDFEKLRKIKDTIYSKNPTLLKEIDYLVSLYTVHSEKKISLLKRSLYFFTFIILLLIIYSFYQLKIMEKNALNFLEESKKVLEQDLDKPLKTINIAAEVEILEASEMLNKFIEKINSAIDDSNNAIIKSKNASCKIEELTNEFDTIISELRNSPDVSKYLNKSEDMAIQSQEYLISSTKRLEELKNEISKIACECNKI